MLGLLLGVCECVESGSSLVMSLFSSIANRHRLGNFLQKVLEKMLFDQKAEHSERDLVGESRSLGSI